MSDLSINSKAVVTGSNSQEVWSWVMDNSNSWLKKIVSEMDSSSSWRLEEPIKIKKKHRPLPSLNVMKKRLKNFFISQRNNNVSKFGKLLSKPYELNEVVNLARDETKMINEFPYKNLEEVRTAYLRFFWYKHGNIED